jgi:hypothetical protein
MVVCSLFLCLNSSKCVDLIWNPSPSVDVEGYRLYWGTNSGVYSKVLDAKNTTKASVINTNFVPKVRYYVVCKAYKTNTTTMTLTESLPSNEFTFVFINSPKSLRLIP